MKNLNLIIDYSNIAMRALFTCSYSAGTSGKFDTEEELSIFARKLTTDIAYVLRVFCPNRVIFVIDDHKPWRSKIYEEYKKNRVKDIEKNWDGIFKTMNDLKDIYKKNGYIISEIKEAEADDIAALWKEKLILTENIILITADKDWLQLVDFDKKTNNYCLSFNPIVNNKGQKVLSVNNDFADWINLNSSTKEESIKNNGMTDIFFNYYNPDKDVISNIRKKDSKINYKEIIPYEVCLYKIFAGDLGDNIPSFYSYYKNGKKINFTELKVKKLLNNLNINNFNDFLNVSETNSLREEFLNVGKINKLDFLDNADFNERLYRQRLLVELVSNNFPVDIIDTFKYQSEDIIKDTPLFNPKDIVAIKMQDILKDTKYISSTYYKPKTAGIFKDLKDMEKYIKPINNTKLF